MKIDFINWKNAAGVVVDQVDESMVDEDESKVITVSAQWKDTDKIHGIKYQLGGGSVTGNRQFGYCEGKTYTIDNLQNATKPGYIFDGWIKDGSNDPASKTINISADERGELTYVAKWSVDPNYWDDKQEESSDDSQTEEDTTVSSDIYEDASMTTLVSSEYATLYVNGANKKVGTDSKKTNFKMHTYYTKFKAADGNYVETTTNKKNKQTSKTYKGKVLAGVTMSSEVPTLTNNKFPTDKTAKAIAKVSNPKTNGSFTVTAQKNGGEVYVWVILAEKKGKSASYTVKASASVKIQVRETPMKLAFLDKPYTDTSAKVYKKETVSLGDSIHVYLNPTKKDGKTAVTEAEYTLSAAKGMEKYVEIEEIEDDGEEVYGYTIRAVGLKSKKKTTVKLTAECTQSTRKATFTLTLVNSARGVTLSNLSKITASGDAVASGDACQYFEAVMDAPDKWNKMTASFDMTPELFTDEFPCTDKPKVYVMSQRDGFKINTNGTVKVTAKPTGANKKLTVSLKKLSVLVKAPKNLDTSANTYVLVVYNTYSTHGYFVMHVSLEQ